MRGKSRSEYGRIFYFNYTDKVESNQVLFLLRTRYSTLEMSQHNLESFLHVLGAVPEEFPSTYRQPTLAALAGCNG